MHQFDRAFSFSTYFVLELLLAGGEFGGGTYVGSFTEELFRRSRILDCALNLFLETFYLDTMLGFSHLKGFPNLLRCPIAFTRIRVSSRGMTLTQFSISSSVTVTKWQFSCSDCILIVPSLVTHVWTLTSCNISRCPGSFFSIPRIRSRNSSLRTGASGNTIGSFLIFLCRAIM